MQVKHNEPRLLFHQRDDKLHDVSEQAGPAFQKYFAVRGLAAGNYHSDGTLDVLDRVNERPSLQALLRGTGSLCRTQPRQRFASAARRFPSVSQYRLLQKEGQMQLLDSPESIAIENGSAYLQLALLQSLSLGA
jgi:hypothetical protein